MITNLITWKSKTPGTPEYIKHTALDRPKGHDIAKEIKESDRNFVEIIEIKKK